MVSPALVPETCNPVGVVEAQPGGVLAGVKGPDIGPGTGPEVGGSGVPAGSPSRLQNGRSNVF